MKKRSLNPTLLMLLALFVCITSVFLVAVTFAASGGIPDLTATYTTENKLEWDVATTDGVADLNIFGDAPEGEEYPLIHPFSRDSYLLRLRNEVRNDVEYSLYVYTDADTRVPLVFNVMKDTTMSTETNIPTELEGKKILNATRGILGAQGLKDLKIDWFWNTESDDADTAIGDAAVDEDIIYNAKVLLVMERDSFDVVTPGGNAGGSVVIPPLPEQDNTLEGVFDRKAYIFGYPDRTFRPNNNTTRAEVAAMFARIHADFEEGNIRGTSTGFSDVESSDWFAKYVSELEDTGIIAGYADGSFRPNVPITRAEFATICVRFFEQVAGEAVGLNVNFTDLNANHWFNQYVYEAVGLGLLKGYPDGTLRPDAYITRSEAVTVVNRLLVRVPDKAFIDENMHLLINYIDVTDSSYWAYYDIYEASNSMEDLIEKEKNEGRR